MFYKGSSVICSISTNFLHNLLDIQCFKRNNWARIKQLCNYNRNTLNIILRLFYKKYNNKVLL